LAVATDIEMWHGQLRNTTRRHHAEARHVCDERRAASKHGLIGPSAAKDAALEHLEGFQTNKNLSVQDYSWL